MDPQSSGARTHVIIVGAGVAGLLAARVLSNHFESVTIIERDALTAQPEQRKGVPQGHHVHGLLAKGQEILAQLFPGLISALNAGGGVSVDMGNDCRWHHHGVWKIRFHSGIEGMLCTRPYLEWHITKRVTALNNARLVNATVERLLLDRARGRIKGVEFCAPSGNATLLADLVLDASGRGSRTPQWLNAVGCAAPDQTTVNVDVLYASRFYRPRPGEWDWKALLVSPVAPSRRLASVVVVERNRWLVTLGGLHGERPPTDEAGYLEYARGLDIPEVYQAIVGAEPLSPIITHRFPSNLRRHYERLGSFPDGLLVLGDAFCCFNPIYGQGMTVSALQAVALDALMRNPAVRRNSFGMPRRFHDTIAKIVDAPWQLTTWEDFRYKEALGKRPAAMALLHWYTGRMFEKSSYDASVAGTFYRVMHMIDAPWSIFHPSIIWKTIGSRRAPGSKQT